MHREREREREREGERERERERERQTDRQTDRQTQNTQIDRERVGGLNQRAISCSGRTRPCNVETVGKNHIQRNLTGKRGLADYTISTVTCVLRVFLHPHYP